MWAGERVLIVLFSFCVFLSSFLLLFGVLLLSVYLHTNFQPMPCSGLGTLPKTPSLLLCSRCTGSTAAANCGTCLLPEKKWCVICFDIYMWSNVATGNCYSLTVGLGDRAKVLHKNVYKKILKKGGGLWDGCGINRCLQLNFRNLSGTDAAVLNRSEVANIHLGMNGSNRKYLCHFQDETRGGGA